MGKIVQSATQRLLVTAANAETKREALSALRELKAAANTFSKAITKFGKALDTKTVVKYGFTTRLSEWQESLLETIGGLEEDLNFSGFGD